MNVGKKMVEGAKCLFVEVVQFYLVDCLTSWCVIQIRKIARIVSVVGRLR